MGAPDILIALCLAMATLGVYAQVRTHAFINYDDPDYIVENPHVQAGLTMAGVRWALTDVSRANWSPLTWLSHMTDVELFGDDSGAHHLVSVGLHVVSTMLLFLVLRVSTDDRWPSALVAFIFGLHPLHVESVAWAAERKDVLFALFWILTMCAYMWYVRGPSVARYALVVIAFCLGLAAKSMIVTLPFALLLFDVWPLGRRLDRRAILEKVPLFAIAVAGSVAAVIAQHQGGALASLAVVPLGARIGNAFYSYVAYLGDFAWPAGLAVFYPRPEHRAIWVPLSAAVALVAMSALAARARRRYSFVATGWFWYLGTLVPVIGLVQIGAQSRADRYTYVPLIGVSIVVAWGLAALCRARPRVRAIAIGGVIVACLACTAIAARQIAMWKDDETLYRHALAVTGDNFVVYTNLGSAYRNDHRREDALDAFQHAVRIKPDSAMALDNYGEALLQLGRAEEALKPIARALEIDPGLAPAYLNLGAALARVNRMEDAVAILTVAVRQWPADANARRNLGSTLVLAGRLDEAIAQLTESLRLQPDSVECRRALDSAIALRRQGGK